MKQKRAGWVKKRIRLATLGAALFAVGAAGFSSAFEAPAVTITILYDNYPSAAGLKTDWGFACLIQGPQKTILFDTGTKPELFLGNLKALKIDPSTIDVVFISHDHGDHTGGLAEFLKLNNKVSVWLPGSLRADIATAYDELVLKAGAEIVRKKDPAEVCPGVRSTGELVGVALEQALIIDTRDGPVVVTGCAHPGILNILRRAREVSGRETALVVGGFHLLQTPEPELREIIRAFKQELGVKKIAATHCTGDGAIALFKEAYGADFVQAGAGRILTFAKGQTEEAYEDMGQSILRIPLGSGPDRRE